MLIALLIIARTAQIGASILLAGTFTFQLVTLGPAGRPANGDLHEVERRLLRLARVESDRGSPLRSALVLAGSREHEWVAADARFFHDSVADTFV